MEAKTRVLVDGLRFPEGPRWHDGKLWCCDFVLRRVVNVDLQGNVQTVFDLPDMPSALGWTPAGELLVVSARAHKLLTQEGGKLIQIADLSQFGPYPLNEQVVDRQGRSYIRNIGFDFGNPQASPLPGPILLVTPEGGARVAADGLAFPNGMVITPDGRTLIVAESYANRLTAYDVEADGSLSHRMVWADLHGPASSASGGRQVSPDGICLDAEGAVWLASPGTREILHVHRGGTVDERVPVDAIPLACMLGGPERRTLFITSTESLDFRDLTAHGRIETVEVHVPGAGLP